MTLRRILPALLGGSPRVRLSRMLQKDGLTVADYDASLGITGTLNATAWANQIGVAPALAEVAGSGPIYLPFVGQKYAWNGNVASNTFTSPNKTVTGNQVFTIELAEDDYTPAADVTLATKTSGNDGFVVKLLTTGVIRLTVGDGAGLTNVDSTVGTGLTDATKHTLAITWTDGVGAAFAIDGAALGGAVAAVKTLTNAAVAITLGPWLGQMYRFQIGSVYDFNAADWSETSTNGATQSSSTTGEVWTLNNTGTLKAQMVGSASLLFDGVADYMQAAFALNQPETVYLVAQHPTYISGGRIFDGATGIVTVGNYTAAGLPGTSPEINAYAGSNGQYEPTALTVGAYHILSTVMNGASSTLQVDSGTLRTGDPGAGNPGGFTLATLGVAPSGFDNLQVKRAVVRNVADSAATQAQIQALLRQIYGTP